MRLVIPSSVSLHILSAVLCQSTTRLSPVKLSDKSGVNPSVRNGSSVPYFLYVTPSDGMTQYITSDKQLSADLSSALSYEWTADGELLGSDGSRISTDGLREPHISSLQLYTTSAPSMSGNPIVVSSLNKRQFITGRTSFCMDDDAPSIAIFAVIPSYCLPVFVTAAPVSPVSISQGVASPSSSAISNKPLITFMPSSSAQRTTSIAIDIVTSSNTRVFHQYAASLIKSAYTL